MPTAATNHRLNLHQGVIKLGLVSFLTDLSSEMVISVFAIFFTTIAGGSTALLGLHIVLLYALFNVACVIAAPPAGWLGDRIGRSRIVVLGYALYGTLNLGAVFVSSRCDVTLLFAVYGLLFAIDESQSKAFIADVEPERGATAIGVYNAVTGALYLPASLAAKALWLIAPRLAFALAGVLSLAAIAVFGVLRPAAQTRSKTASKPAPSSAASI